VELETALAKETLETVSVEMLRRGQADGVGDRNCAFFKAEALAAGQAQGAWGIAAVIQGWIRAAPSSRGFTPYLYSSYEGECEATPADRKKFMILGSGPNRIGQGNRSSITAAPRRKLLRQCIWH